MKRKPGIAWRTLVENERVYIVNGWRSEDGQDLVEYALILCFIALSGAAILTGMNGSIDAIWSIINSRLSSAAS